MISQSTIDRIKNLDVADVIGEYLELKPAGSNKVARCPFHNEQSASFNVSSSRGIFKCFGCGASGDAIQFVSDFRKVAFHEAVELITHSHGIPFELDSHYTVEELQEKKAKKAAVQEMMSFVQKSFVANLRKAKADDDVWQWLASRGITPDIAKDWQLGFAPDHASLNTALIERGWFNYGTEYGLIGTKQGRNYDQFRNRITLPSYDHLGVLNGFIGRTIADVKPKYINPPQSDIYNKSKTIFGMKEAAPFIREQGFVYMVEGNLDCKMLQSHGYENTIAPGGTALTAEQVLLIKRHTSHVVLIPDADDAGIKAAHEQIDLLLGADFRVEVAELPWGEDPDSYLRRHLN